MTHFPSQLAVISMLRIATREKVTREFYFALKEIAAEQQRCERVLGLLLPPTLVSTSKSYTCTIITHLLKTLNPSGNLPSSDHVLSIMSATCRSGGSRGARKQMQEVF